MSCPLATKHGQQSPPTGHCLPSLAIIQPLYPHWESLAPTNHTAYFSKDPTTFCLLRVPDTSDKALFTPTTSVPICAVVCSCPFLWGPFLQNRIIVRQNPRVYTWTSSSLLPRLPRYQHSQTLPSPTSTNEGKIFPIMQTHKQQLGSLSFI